MAQLSKTPVPGFGALAGESIDAWWRRTEARFKELQAAADAVPKGKVVGRLVSFPIADGFAIYRVAKEVPLELQHIPVGDCRAIPSAHLRGLRLVDVRRLLGVPARRGEAE